MKRINALPSERQQAFALDLFHFNTSDVLREFPAPDPELLERLEMTAEQWAACVAAALADRLEAEEQTRRNAQEVEVPEEPASEEPEDDLPAAPPEASPPIQTSIAGRPVGVYNPLGTPVEDLPVVYGFTRGGPSGEVQGALVSEDGIYFGSHTASSEVYLPGDLEILESHFGPRHVAIRKAYPAGYRMEFVRHFDVGGHEGLRAALERLEENES